MSLKIACPKCRGKKTMNDPKYIGMMLGYCDRDGNSCPQVTCITCGGAGHVLDKSSPYIIDEEAVKKAREIKPEMPRLPFEPTIAELEAELQQAIAAQDYERCAKLRDKLARMKGH